MICVNSRNDGDGCSTLAGTIYSDFISLCSIGISDMIIEYAYYNVLRSTFKSLFAGMFSVIWIKYILCCLLANLISF